MSRLLQRNPRAVGAPLSSALLFALPRPPLTHLRRPLLAAATLRSHSRRRSLRARRPSEQRALNERVAARSRPKTPEAARSLPKRSARPADAAEIRSDRLGGSRSRSRVSFVDRSRQKRLLDCSTARLLARSSNKRRALATTTSVCAQLPGPLADFRRPRTRWAFPRGPQVRRAPGASRSRVQSDWPPSNRLEAEPRSLIGRAPKSEIFILISMLII